MRLHYEHVRGACLPLRNLLPTRCLPGLSGASQKIVGSGFRRRRNFQRSGLTDLAETTNEMFSQQARQTAFSFGFRVYAEQEYEALGTAAIGFIEFLESAEVINAIQREIVIERACAINESPIQLDKLKVIVLMVLWTRRGNVDALILDELLPDGEKRQMH